MTPSQPAGPNTAVVNIEAPRKHLLTILLQQVHGLTLQLHYSPHPIRQILTKTACGDSSTSVRQLVASSATTLDENGLAAAACTTTEPCSLVGTPKIRTSNASLVENDRTTKFIFASLCCLLLMLVSHESLIVLNFQASYR